MDNYKLVASLIINVLTKKTSVQDALSKFPKVNDINLKCAFDALVHYEADEDLRLKTEGYSRMQDDYLEYIASVLSKGEKLPKDIINRYYKYHKDILISDNEKGLRGFMKYIKRIINF